MSQRVLLGMLTPSSNTVLEPVSSAIVHGLPNVSVHFSRFELTQISLGANAAKQFNLDLILQAAKLLADAKVDVIAWNGTSAGWLGFETDEHLCNEVTKSTGIPATTSVLAFNEILEKTAARKLGFVSPYTEDIQNKIVENYQQAGFNCIAERHLNLKENHSFAEVTDQQIISMVREVASYQPQAITTFCTNLKAAHLVAQLEAETGIPIYDTVTTAVWKSLRIAGFDTRSISGWGRLFQEVA